MGWSPRSWIAAVAPWLACTCSGDLFHGTDWRSSCEADPSAPGCAPSATSSGDGGQAAGATSTSSATTGGGAAASCEAPADCPAPANDCSLPSCSRGRCSVTFVAAGRMLADQVPGDCALATCDGDGNVVAAPDPMDADDGLPCTVDSCGDGGALHVPAAVGAKCAENGGTVCNERGACVECTPNDMVISCPSGTICKNETCIPTSCNDFKLGLGETDVDCGGPACPPCAAGKNCLVDGDCASATCDNGICG